MSLLPRTATAWFSADAWHTETKHFIYFYIGTLAILIWKS